MILFLRIANLVLFVVNIALFALWCSMIRRDSLPPGGEAATYVLSELTLSVAVLGIVIALGAVLLAGLGFFGFQVISERTIATADQAARETVSAWLAKREPEALGGEHVGPKGPLPAVGKATKEKEES